MMGKITLCLVTVLFLAACTGDFNEQDGRPSQLVVEGWVEDGGFPVVMLTRSLQVSKDYQKMDELGDYIIRWAKVVVNNGTDSVVLTGKYDNGYFPPFVYTTNHMRGEVGKQYTLTVEYKDYYAEATTTIPSVPDQCKFYVKKCDDSDTLYQIKAKFTDNPWEKNFYQLFIRMGTEEKQYSASYLGSFDDAVLNNEVEVPVYRRYQLGKEKYTPYFTENDTVSVKFAQVDEMSFRIWDSFTKNLSLSGNMFLSTSSDIVTNISGGYGYWCGYGVITDHIIIHDSVSTVSPSR